MRHVFIVNPMAGKRDSVQKLLSRIREVYPQGGYEVYATQAAGDAHRLAMEAIEGGEPVRLYACGGVAAAVCCIELTLSANFAWIWEARYLGWWLAAVGVFLFGNLWQGFWAMYKTEEYVWN